VFQECAPFPSIWNIPKIFLRSFKAVAHSDLFTVNLVEDNASKMVNSKKNDHLKSKSKIADTSRMRIYFLYVF